MEQPQWFYSSLARVTAAIVGFVGGFLLVRLLEVMRDWSGLVDRLRKLGRPTIVEAAPVNLTGGIRGRRSPSYCHFSRETPSNRISPRR